MQYWRQSFESQFFSLNLFWYRHFDTSSSRVLTKLSPAYSAMCNFSFVHSIHLFDTGLYPGKCFTILHLMLYCPFCSLIFDTSPASFVLVSYFLFLKAALWLLNLDLNGGSHIPRYILVPYPGIEDDNVAFYRLLAVKQFPWSGQFSLTLQLQVFSFLVSALERTFLLCEFLIVFILGMQL